MGNTLRQVVVVHQSSVLVMFLEEFHHPCSESGDDYPNHKPRDSECSKEQNETSIVQPRCGNGDRERLTNEEHRSVVLEYRIVMAELVLNRPE